MRGRVVAELERVAVLELATFDAERERAGSVAVLPASPVENRIV